MAQREIYISSRSGAERCVMTADGITVEFRIGAAERVCVVGSESDNGRTEQNLSPRTLQLMHIIASWVMAMAAQGCTDFDLLLRDATFGARAPVLVLTNTAAEAASLKQYAGFYRNVLGLTWPGAVDYAISVLHSDAADDKKLMLRTTALSTLGTRGAAKAGWEEPPFVKRQPMRLGVEFRLEPVVDVQRPLNRPRTKRPPRRPLAERQGMQEELSL